ncbi:52 kDa repressor of the inhibitor of the protein kinase-like [Rhopalosiphum padi]|uniref:52 kDa repressor of the inhibitor of the protein kinase-like n=1 Tax=Rhopalosiphum padi TaxID=40932 RepID=UPI00298E52E3|nr:52 kDa repressor of the inhibitor of the protein kinase-like [Rhopalosiphum padi]
MVKNAIWGGHRDDGQLEINSAITGDQGVFRSLLAFRLDSGDEILREHLENCVHNGVQALILEEQPLALYTHCFSHGLNLAISKACEIPAIRNMFGIVGSVSVFLSLSAKRNNTLIRVISNDSTESHPNKIKLKALCATRWVERHNSIIMFHDLYKFILIALEELEKDSNRETSYKAANFNSSVRRSEFLVSLEIVANLFAYTKTLSIQLQSSKQDLSMAQKNIKNIIALFNSIRENPEDTFNSLFENAAKKAQMFGEKIKIPRLCGQQTQRSNIVVREPMDWFKVTIFIPFLDHIIHELDSRFNEKFNNIIALEGLIPSNINFYDTKSILESAKFYCDDIEGSDLELKAEIHLWKNKWTNVQNNPQTAVEALEYCNEFFPNIKILLQIFATLPVSTATAERSFSTLRRLKNYLRSTMSEVRLNGSAMLNIHKEIDIKQVVDTFAQKKKGGWN